jgi:putative endopeptidase
MKQKRLKLKTATSLGFIAAAMSMTACNSVKKEAKFADKGIHRTNLDTTANPVQDFYQFANGGWLKNNPIPSTEARWGSFNELQEFNNAALHKVVETDAADTKAAKGSNTQKVGDFYAAGMDSVNVEKAGITPLKAELDQIDGIKDIKGVIDVVTAFQMNGVGPLFNFYAYQDPKNSAAVVPQTAQGGLGLPDRDYYLNNDQRSVTIRKEYMLHLAKMFELMGSDAASAKKQADATMALETGLAKASMTRVELRDPDKTYHKMTVKEINALTPSFDWSVFLTKVGVNQQDYMIVGQPDFLKEVEKQLKPANVEALKSYLRYQLITTYASKLSSNFVNENFHFYATVLNGTKQIKPRWKRVLQDTDGLLGEALGQEYVKTNFTPEAKARCLEMINNLQAVFKKRIQNLDWMAPETKTKATAKLETFIKKIGYPDKWKDYSKLDITRESYVRNCVNANKFAFTEMIAKVGKPVDKTEWGMTPPTVNAYYNPSINEIVFPAGILQSPFFDPNADDAVNYGGIGAVIGHEMTHGFDDEGRKYDAEGNLKDWWTKADGDKFVAKADRVVKQFNGYAVLDTLHVNGALTLGENLADLGGLSLAYEAFKMTEQGKSNEKIDGFTPDQRFFLGWAQGWRNNQRDEATAQRIKTDPHSPGKYRTNGPLSNMPEFYAAFGVKPGDAMYRADDVRAKVW